MAATRTLPFEPAELLRSMVPFGPLVLAAAVPGWRGPLLLVLAIGTPIAVGYNAPVRWVWAGTVPVAFQLFWETFDPPATARYVPDWIGPTTCSSMTSSIANRQALEAIVILVVLVIFALVVRARPASLYLRFPGRRWFGWAAIGLVASGAVGLLLGPYLAQPFFGPVDFEIVPIAFLPAFVFAISNGVSEEVIYRGALMGWAARAIGIWPALVGQAVVFGLAHSGADVIGFQVSLMLAMGLAGLLAGLVTIRTRSLLIPVAVHVGLDIPIYFAFACSS